MTPIRIPDTNIIIQIPLLKIERIIQVLAGPKGKVRVVTSFGYSAPYKVLDKKIGFTAANIYSQVEDYLARYKK